MNPQLPPEGISQSAWDEARRVWAEMLTVDHGASDFHTQRDCEELAQAIMAATAAERERCACVVGQYTTPIFEDSPDDDREWNAGVRQIAAAIRKPQNDNFKSVPHMGPVA